MPELTEQLAELAELPAPAPSDATVQADLRRARGALTRRRRSLTAAVALVAAVATAGSLAYATRSGTTDPAAGRGSARAGTPSQQIRLVAYHGDQLPGFIVSEVPEGYVLQGATSFSLDIAQPGDNSSVDSFDGKLVVMLQSQDAHFDTHGTPVTINGHQGYLRDGSPATDLEYTDGTHDILIQDWNNVALTADQLVQFASGVTVTSAAQAGRG
jgi:hypothetical protein